MDLALRYGGVRMPTLGLSDNDAADLIAYIKQQTDEIEQRDHHAAGEAAGQTKAASRRARRIIEATPSRRGRRRQRFAPSLPTSVTSKDSRRVPYSMPSDPIGMPDPASPTAFGRASRSRSMSSGGTWPSNT